MKKNRKTKSETDVFSMKFDRTDLIIGQSKVKNCEESAGDVRIGVAPQKPMKNCQEHDIFIIFPVLGESACRFFFRPGDDAAIFFAAATRRWRGGGVAGPPSFLCWICAS